MEALTPKDWTTRHVATWCKWLRPLVGRCNVRALEIGCCAGQSSEWFCREILTGPGASLDCIDAWLRYPTAEAEFDARTVGFPIAKHKGTSTMVLAELLAAGARYDLIYVDGSHHAEQLLYDLSVSWAMLRRGGILIADDYRHTSRRLRLPPRVAIDAWLACVVDSLAGYEISRHGQMATWKRS